MVARRLQRQSNTVYFLGTKPLFDKKELREKGIFDGKDVLMFDTLHEIRVNATLAFHNNPLFGTFQNGKYNWMSYGEWGKTVDVCRNVLKDLGKFLAAQILHYFIYSAYRLQSYFS